MSRGTGAEEESEDERFDSILGRIQQITKRVLYIVESRRLNGLIANPGAVQIFSRVNHSRAFNPAYNRLQLNRCLARFCPGK